MQYPMQFESSHQERNRIIYLQFRDGVLFFTREPSVSIPDQDEGVNPVTELGDALRNLELHFCRTSVGVEQTRRVHDAHLQTCAVVVG